jgi:allantoinase
MSLLAKSAFLVRAAHPTRFFVADLIVRGANVVTPDGIDQLEIAIENGTILELAPTVTSKAKEEINAEGLHIFPGLIDVHVHFNEPGRTEWEGIKTGSSAFAAGGGTLYVDMPLNSSPPVLNKESFLAKKQAAEASSLTDFALWGGLTPDNLEHLEDLADLGVIGFKAFMSNSGIDDFKAVDDLTLYEGMKKAAELGLPVAVHAESEAITSALTKRIRDRGGKSVKDYLQSRPVIAELEAISRALLFAKETSCDLHIVHVSSRGGVALVTEARNRGISVTCETCPHYLHLTEDDVEKLGAVAKCAPPLRSNEERLELWQSVVRGEVDLIASDHSPSSPDLKERDDFFAVWGGISGVQSTLQILLTHSAEQQLSLQHIAALTATNPAERFRLANKGKIQEGYDADLTLVNLTLSETLTKEKLFYRHKQSPYVGQTFKGVIKQTLLRGQTVFKDGNIVANPLGRFIKVHHEIVELSFLDQKVK